MLVGGEIQFSIFGTVFSDMNKNLFKGSDLAGERRVRVLQSFEFGVDLDDGR